MAILDKACNTIVLRIIYAGAPLSGKTETIRSLSTLLLGERSAKGAVYSPEETQGRTLFFDWLDYKAGLFRGYQIRCQIISVPGQKSLQSRRQQLLKNADSVVFVLDSSLQDSEENKHFYQELQDALQQDDDPASILVQANKEDLNKNLNDVSIREALNADSKQRIINSIATKDKGIREGFILAVNMAISRAGRLMDNDHLPIGSPDINSGDDLLALIKEQEQHAQNQQVETEIDLSSSNVADIDISMQSLSTLINDNLEQEQQAGSVSSTVKQEPDIIDNNDIVTAKNEDVNLTDLIDLTDILNADEYNSDEPEPEPEPEPEAIKNVAIELSKEAATTTEKTINATNTKPTIEDQKLAAGSIWPPVAGRLIFSDIQQNLPITLLPTESAWQAKIKQTWCLYTCESFENQWKGRQRLIKTVHDYNHLAVLLSEQRCVFLADSADKQLWLWHVAKYQNSTATVLQQVLVSKQVSSIAQVLHQTSICFMQAHEKLKSLQHQANLKLTDLAWQHEEAVFINTINDLKIAFSIDATEINTDLDDALYTQLHPLMHDSLQSGELDIPLILNALKQIQSRFNLNSNTLDMLNRLLIGH